jgi:hypothetical protein
MLDLVRPSAIAGGHAVVHEAFGVVTRHYAAQLNLPIISTARTVRNVGNNEILKIRVADEYEAACCDQSVQISAGVGTGVYSSGKGGGIEDYRGNENKFLHLYPTCSGQRDCGAILVLFGLS